MNPARRGGVLVPLFSLRSSGGWGIGEFPDLARFAAWAARAGQHVVQLLPMNELPADEHSPYSAMTAMALDPIYISLPAVAEFAALGGEDAFDEEDRARLARLRAAPGVVYAEARAFKDRWMRRAWERFARVEVAGGTPRAARWRAFAAAEAWWLRDYALFRALHAAHDGRAWWDWPEALARRDAEAVQAAEQALAGEMEYWSYVQWTAAEQWAEARRVAAPVQVFGDLPFMISANSPDVWARQAEFRFDATVGVPPDAFSETGQDWGLPPWRWEVMQENGFDWIRGRARRAAALYDGLRLDHLVGLYRIYVRPRDADVAPFFTPGEPEAQRTLGETLVGLFRDAGVELVAEDLGTVPDFVRESIARLGVPGCRVMRWERRWHEAEQPFIDPAEYPEVSMATTGTHDTEPLATWWDELAAADRAAVLALPSVAAHLAGAADPARAFDATIRDALLRAVFAAGSRLAIVPVQDLFGWRDRINTPGTVAAVNWAWSLPWAVEAWTQAAEPVERAATLRAWAGDSGR